MWRWPRKGDRQFLTADVGGGDPDTRDGDWSVIVVGVLNEWDNDEVIMRWRGHLNPVVYAWVIATLAWGVRAMVGDNVVAPEIVPEWTGPGRATCVELDLRHPYPNLYRYQHPGVQGMPKTKHIGWESNNKTKPLMVKYMLNMVNNGYIDIPDEEFVQEASRLQTDELV